MNRKVLFALVVLAAIGVAWLARVDLAPSSPEPASEPAAIEPAVPATSATTTAERAPERLSAQSVHSAIASADRADAPDPAAELTGVVELASGAPAVGADVVLTTVPARGWVRLAGRLGFLERRVHARTKTDERGRFAFYVAPGRAFDVEAVLAGVGVARASEVSGPKSLAMRLEPFATLDVRVTNEGGAPVRDARVLVCERVATEEELVEKSNVGGIPARAGRVVQSDDAYLRVADARTDVEGRCVLQELPPGTWTVVTAPEATLPAVEPVSLHAGERREVALVARAGRALRAYVTTFEAHAPIADAEVRMLDFPWKRVRTDERGYATIVGAAGVTRLAALADGRAEQRIEQRIEVAAETFFAFSLRPEQRVRGRVVDVARRPMAGVDVLVLGARWEGGTSLVRGAETLEDGTFAVDGLDPTLRSAVVVREEGFAPLVVRANDPPTKNVLADKRQLLPGPPVVDVGDLVLAAPARASGVVQYLDGSPAADVALTLRVGLSNRVGDVRDDVLAFSARLARSDLDGRFVFDDLVDRSYVLQAGSSPPPIRSPELEERLRFTLGAGESKTDLVLVVPHLYTLHGTVLDPWGDVVAGALVQPLPWGKEVACDGSGRFEIELDSAAPTAIEARCTQSPYTAGRETVELFPARLERVTPSTNAVVLQLVRAVPIRGVVTRAKKPAPSHGVQALDEHGVAIATAFTDADGAFELSIPEHAIVTLTVRPPVDPSGKSGLRIRAADEPVARVPSVQAGREGLAIELPPR